MHLDNESKVKEFGKKLAQCSSDISDSIVIYLEGDLGAGKTTIARSFIQYFGFDKVKSPTYSIVESYQNQKINIHHFDCYRLADPEELDYIGVREYLKPGHIQLIEWSQMGIGMLSPADLSIKINIDNNSRELEFSANSTTGEKLINCFN